MRANARGGIVPRSSGSLDYAHVKFFAPIMAYAETRRLDLAVDNANPSTLVTVRPIH